MQGWIRLVYCSQKYGFFEPCPKAVTSLIDSITFSVRTYHFVTSERSVKLLALRERSKSPPSDHTSDQRNGKMAPYEVQMAGGASGVDSVNQNVRSYLLTVAVHPGQRDLSAPRDATTLLFASAAGRDLRAGSA